MAAELQCEIVEIAPPLARELLIGNTRNRNLRDDYVKKLAGAMKRGEWTLNGEPVQISEEGELLNGQHRLSAVVESGETVQMLVVRGLPVSSQLTMDTGTRRNLSDVLALHGESDTANLGAMLGMLYRYRKGLRLDNASRTAPTPQEALELLRQEPGIREGLAVGRKVFRATRMRVSVTGILFYIFEEVDPGEGEKFFDALCKAEDEPPESPIVALKKILDRARRERTYRLSTYTLNAITIKAFNAWREGREMRLIAFRPGGASPEPFPDINPPL